MASEPVQFMQQVVSLEYKFIASPIMLEFGAALHEQRIIGHRCPACDLVYVPPTGFCAICVVPTNTQDHGVDVSDRGLVTSFTVVDPIQYRGQEEKGVYVLASILLDGASGTMGQQRIEGVDPGDVRMGTRIKAVWFAGDERKGFNPRAPLGGAIKHWSPSGEPDAPLESFSEHII